MAADDDTPWGLRSRQLEEHRAKFSNRLPAVNEPCPRCDHPGVNSLGDCDECDPWYPGKHQQALGSCQ